MKTRNFIIIVLIAISFSACKDEKKTEVENSAPVVEKKENFSVEVDVITDKDDDFPLYYTENGTVIFDDSHAVWSGVKGQSQQQTVVLNLSDEIIPTHIRIDFGINKGDEQGDVLLKRFKMSYYGKSFEIKGSDFLKYFNKNEATKTEVDDANGTIKFVKDQNGAATPFFYPQQTLIDEIRKITT